MQVNSPELDADEQRQVSEVVGLGAIKYADLSQNRISDYVFDWEKMFGDERQHRHILAVCLRAYQSTFRKGGVAPASIREQNPPIAPHPPGRTGLGVRLLRFPEVLDLAVEDLKPNILTDYLFDLASAFSSFYSECPVIKAESAARRDSRYALLDVTARTLKKGLSLLGIGVVERM